MRPPPTSPLDPSWDSDAASRCSTSTLDRSIYAYTSACYYETIYIQGGNLLDDARRKMGSSAFWAALRGYIADNRYEIAGHALAAGRAGCGDAARPVVDDVQPCDSRRFAS